VSNQAKTSKDFTPRLLAQSTAKFHINAPTTDIDITDWLFNIDELEYINCTPQSRAHLSAGFTHSPDGKRMSINVEDIGGALIIEHYHEAISEMLHCRVVSTSDLLLGREYTTAHVIWELIAAPVDGVHHEFVNNVWAHTTEKFEQYLEAHHKVPYDEVRRNFQTALAAHNAEETPFFAAAIERKARSKKKS
jgi:frataxin-like iron-binding protein CyaY